MAQAITKLSSRPSAAIGGSGGGVGTISTSKPSNLRPLRSLVNMGVSFIEARQRDEAAELREITAQQKAASKAFSSAVQVGMEDQLAQNFNQFPNNPGVNKDKGEALISGLVDILPELARPVFRAKGTKSLNEKIAKSNKNAKAVLIARQTIQVDTLQAQLVGRLKSTSKNRFSDEDDLRVAATEELISVQAEMLAPLMETGIDFEGNEFALSSEEEIEKAVDNINVLSLEAGTEGWFDSQESMAVAYQTIVDGDFRIPNATGEGEFAMGDVLAELPDKGRAMLARLNTKMTARNSVNDEQDRLDDEARDKEQAFNLFDAYETIENPNSEKARITPGDIEEMVLAGEIDPAKAIPLLKAATAPEVVRDDPLLFNLLTSMLLADQDIETFVNDSDGRLKPKTLWQLRKENKTNQARLAGAVQSDLESLIKQEEKSMIKVINTIGPFGIPDPNLNQRLAEATTEYNRRVDAGEDPVEVRREMVRRSRAEAINNDDFTSPLIKPRFMPMARNNITADTLKQGARRLVANHKTGKISNAEFAIQKKLFIQWNRQLEKKAAALVLADDE